MIEFNTESIFQALKSPLGVIDNPERRQQIEQYIEAARLPLERAVFDLLSQLAEAVGTDVTSHYEVNLGYRPGLLTLDVRPREPGEPPDEPWSMAEGDVEKITLRLPAELKELAAEAASGASLSVNGWFVRVLARALRTAAQATESSAEERHGRWHQGHGRQGRRLSGWVGPEE